MSQKIILREDIELFNLRDIVGDKNVKFVKMNIEEAEKDLSRDSQLDNDDILMVDLHENIVSGCKAAFDEFSRKRRSFNFINDTYITIKNN